MGLPFGYKFPSRNVVCAHCGEHVSALQVDRAWMIAEYLESYGPGDIDELADELGISRELARRAVRVFRDHLQSEVGKAIVCARDLADPSRHLYQLSDQWREDDVPDVQDYEMALTKRLRAEAMHMRDAAIIAYEKMDGRKRRQRAEVGDMASILGSLVERIDFMRERLVILAEELEAEAS